MEREGRDDFKDNAKVKKKKKTTNTGIIVSTVLTEVKTMNLEEVLQFCFYQTVQFPQIPLPGKPRGILPLVSAGVVLGLQCLLRTSILLMLTFRSRHSGLVHEVNHLCERLQIDYQILILQILVLELNFKHNSVQTEYVFWSFKACWWRRLSPTLCFELGPVLSSLAHTVVCMVLRQS